MGYVAAKGGTEAIEQAEQLVQYYRLRGGSTPIKVRQIQDQFRLAVDKVMGEGSLYSPFHAALALKQAEGDTIEAVLLIRAFRSTCPRTRVSLVADTSEMRVVRRISAAFQDVPGGQLLGPTVDYTQRLLNFSLCDESEAHVRAFMDRYLGGLAADGCAEAPASFSKVIEILKREGMVASSNGAAEVTASGPPSDGPYDITRTPLVFPAPRAARLQALARGETGGLLALAYSSMRGYGDIHPTVGELRVGSVPLRIPHPAGGPPVFVGRVLVTEAEVVAWFDGTPIQDRPMFSLGYGLCFGHNELKAISMAVLDRAMNAAAPKAPAEDEEFVLSHIDPIESSGFASHWKLPHYVTFQADVDRLRAVQRHAETGGPAGGRRGDGAAVAAHEAIADPAGADREGG
jgi:alpha-D-ribose 1-methylphosphonate 5-triphosphate synthase subunit PhnI